VIQGSYLSSSDGSLVDLAELMPGFYHAHSDTWDGVGMFDGTMYLGVFRMAARESTVAGTHMGKLQADGTLAVHGEFAKGGKPFDVLWKRQPKKAAPPQPVPPPSAPGEGPPADRITVTDDPKPGDYVFVEELPETITKVQPENPSCGAQGTVLIQALVGKDGRVKDTRVVGSIPCLDEAARSAVRQWVFKPALAKGSPVAVWVAVPVRFPAN
jgi:protein TonB